MKSRRKRQLEIRQHIAQEHGLDNLIAQVEEARRFSKEAPELIEKLDQEFSKLTGLNKTDYTFLFFATALQVVRWILQESVGQEQPERKPHNGKEIKTEEEKSKKKFKEAHKNDEVVQGEYKDWKSIISDGVPYDLTAGSKDALGKGLNGKDHRLRTLGHDPYLGWVFGTANIMTDTCTTTYEGSWNIVKNSVSGRREFGTPTSISKIFSDAYSSTQEDKIRLAAAVCKQGMHIASDIETIQGLPIPVITKLWPSLAARLNAGGYDYLDLKYDISQLGIVAKQAAYATLINFIIAVIHDFFYKEEEYPNHDLYEVKTRKILLYSNLIASASNVIYVAIASAMGDPKAWKEIDFGGLAVTIYRLFSDLDFIYSVKEEFIKDNFTQKLTESINISLEEFEAISPEDFIKINDKIKGKNMNNSKSNFVDKLISLVPVWGYYHGTSEGFKRGMEDASQKYEEIFKQFRCELTQMERDIFGKDNAFISPEGWDKVYWCNCLKHFIDGNDIALSAREILFAFIKAFLEKMDKKNIKSFKGAPLTYTHLSMAQCTISTEMDKLLYLDKSFLEITMDFLVLFSPLEYDNNYKKLAGEIKNLRNEIATILSNSSSCNILAIGRTGVGKSSLLNYLLGKEIFVAASGKPQTMGFDEATGVVNNIKVTIYDSRGLETGDDAYDYEEFMYELKKFKQRHDVFQAPYDWIHAAVYCIPKRYQPVDCEIINACLEDNFNVIVALTKMDGLDEEQVQSIIAQLQKDCPCLKPEKIIPVCSVDKIDREGNIVKPFGREKLIEAASSAFKDTVLQYLPRRCVLLAQAEVDNFRDDLKSQIASRDMAWFCNNEDVDWFKNEVNEFQRRFCEEVFPEIISNEMSEVVESFCKTIFCYYGTSDKSISPIYYDEILKPMLIKTFGTGLGSAITTAIARNVSITVGSKLLLKPAIATAIGGWVPGINILLGILSAAFIGIDFWNKNDKLRQEFYKVLDEFAENLKEELTNIEEHIRKNLSDSIK